MVELVSVEDFSWLDPTNPQLNGSYLDIINYETGGGVGHPYISTGSTSWVTVTRAGSSGIYIGPNTAFLERCLVLSSVGRPDEKHQYGNFCFSASMPSLEKYRTGKSCFGMSLAREASISSNPGAVYISSGMSGTGSYIFPATGISDLFIEVEIDWDTGTVDIYYNSTKVVSYTFTRETTSTAYPSNTIQAYFGNIYASSYLTGGSSTTLTSFWINSSSRCFPCSYYCAHDEAGSSPRMGKVYVCSPTPRSEALPGSEVSITSTGFAFSPSSDPRAEINTCVQPKSYIDSTTGAQKTEVTPSAKSSGKATLQVTLPDIGNLPGYVVVGAGLVAKAINKAPSTPAAVKLTLDCGGGKVVSGRVNVDTSHYGIRESLPIITLDSLPTTSVKDISGKLEIV